MVKDGNIFSFGFGPSLIPRVTLKQIQNLYILHYFHYFSQVLAIVLKNNSYGFFFTYISRIYLNLYPDIDQCIETSHGKKMSHFEINTAVSNVLVQQCKDRLPMGILRMHYDEQRNRSLLIFLFVGFN